MLELRVATAKPRLKVVLDGFADFPPDDEARIASELPIRAALH